MKKMLIVLLALCLAIPAMAFGSVLTDESGFTDPSTGRYYSVRNITVRDRFGTELQGVVVFDDKGSLVASFQGSGPGIGNNAFQGAVAGFEQGLGLGLGLGLQKPANYSGGNSYSDSSAGGGSASAKASQHQSLRSSTVNTNTNLNCNTNTLSGGKTPW